MALPTADEERACSLSDRGTSLAQRDGLELAVLFEGELLCRLAADAGVFVRSDRDDAGRVDPQ